MRSRLGDDIDDFCVKCKRVMNHLVVSLLHDEPAKVRCRTCHGDHDFRHEQAPPPKIDARKAALIQQALEKAVAAAGGDGALVAGVGLDDTLSLEATPLPATPLQAAAMVAAADSANSAAAAVPTRPARKSAKAK